MKATFPSAKRKRIHAMARQVRQMTADEIAKGVGGRSVETVEGHELSAINSLLTLLQDPEAKLVGGYNQWAKFGRHVKKGASGIGIWVPMGVGTLDSPNNKSPKGYRIGYVFDISQTEGINNDTN